MVKNTTSPERMAELRGYRKAKRRFENEKRQEIYKIFGALGDRVLDILDSMVQASVSNPLLGITSSAVIADILYRAKVIDIATFTMIMVSAGVLEGAAVAGEIIQDVSDFFKFFQSSAQSPDPIRPSALTVVFGNKKDDVQALMGEKGVTEQ